MTENRHRERAERAEEALRRTYEALCDGRDPKLENCFFTVRELRVLAVLTPALEAARGDEP